MLQRGWSIFLDKTLFIVTWQQGTACMALYSDLCFPKFILKPNACRVDAEGVIKVADFGLTESIYSNNYFKRIRSEDSQEKVPIRWMAPESIESCLYTEVTDVVSFYNHFK